MSVVELCEMLEELDVVPHHLSRQDVTEAFRAAVKVRLTRSEEQSMGPMVSHYLMRGSKRLAVERNCLLLRYFNGLDYHAIL
jgi:hypothetical protein